MNNSNTFQPHNFTHFHNITSLLSAAVQESVVAKKTGFYRPMKVRMCRMSEPIHNQEHENSSKHRQQGSPSFGGFSPLFHHEPTLNGDVVALQQRLLLYPDANYSTSFSQYCSRTTAVRTYKKRSHSTCPYLQYIHDTATVGSHTSTPAVLPGHLSSLKGPVVWRTAVFLLTAGTGQGDVRFLCSFTAFFFPPSE